MNTRRQREISPFSGIGEPRRDEVTVTVLTALILFVALVFVALFG